MEKPTPLAFDRSACSASYLSVIPVKTGIEVHPARPAVIHDRVNRESIFIPSYLRGPGGCLPKDRKGVLFNLSVERGEDEIQRSLK
jgi:hypothetical protein